jgi:hypothetical protein
MGNLGFQEALLLAALCIVIVPFIFYLLTLQNTLKIISARNRGMKPDNVWVMLVPFVNAIFIFFIVDAVGISLKREYEKYGVIKASKPTYGVGLAMSILFIAGAIIPFASFAGLVCWIVHWVQVNQCKNEIKNLQETYNTGSNEPSIFLS